MEEQTFKIGDKIQYYYSGMSKNIVHPIGIVKGIVNQKGNHHQKVIVQFGEDKPRRVYANDYRIVDIE